MATQGQVLGNQQWLHRVNCK